MTNQDEIKTLRAEIQRQEIGNDKHQPHMTAALNKRIHALRMERTRHKLFSRLDWVGVVLLNDYELTRLTLQDAKIRRFGFFENQMTILYPDGTTTIHYDPETKRIQIESGCKLGEISPNKRFIFTESTMEYR